MACPYFPILFVHGGRRGILQTTKCALTDLGYESPEDRDHCLPSSIDLLPDTTYEESVLITVDDIYTP